MKMRCLFFVLLSVIGVSAQSRTITNVDLEPYRAKRLAAERELRENYSKLGFPSPIEFERRNLESARQLSELSSRLRNERLDRERREAEARTVYYYAFPQYPIVQQQATPEFYWSYGRWYRLPRSFVPQVQQNGYFAGGQFWPTGPRTPSAPMYGPRH